MRSAQKIVIGVAVLVMVIAVGVIIGLMGGGTPSTTDPVVPVTSTPQPAPPPPDPTPPPIVNSRPPVEPVRPVPRPQPTSNPIAPTPAVQSGTILTNWEDRLNEILASEDDDTNKARVLLEMFPQLPAEGQVETAEHLLNLLAGQDYTPLAQMLKDPKLSEEVQDVILSDALNWPNTTKLPLLLDIARNPDHPKHGEALDWLDLYLAVDQGTSGNNLSGAMPDNTTMPGYGTNWNKWEEAMRDYLKNNPDE